MGIGTLWIKMLLTLVLLDFAARRLPSRIERWLFYSTIAALVIGFMMKVMHWAHGNQIVLTATFVQFCLFLFGLRIQANKRMLNYVILLWLGSTFLENLFNAYHIHDKGAVLIINACLFLVYTTWYFYILVMESKSKKAGSK